VQFRFSIALKAVALCCGIGLQACISLPEAPGTNLPLQADFAATSAQGRRDTVAAINNGFKFRVTFSDSSKPGEQAIQKWEWDFDNNGTIDATGKGPHRYAYAGRGCYAVKLRVSDGVQQDSSIKRHYIKVYRRYNPTACFTFQSDGLNVTFADSSFKGGFIENGSDVTNWSGREWNFGDGQKSNLPNPSHSYAAAGTYTVSLIVFAEDQRDFRILSDTVTQKVVVTLAQ